MKRRRKTAAALAALCAAALAAGCTAGQVARGIGSAWRMGKARFQPYTWKEELEIGGTVAAKLAAGRPIVEDKRATEYVNLVAATVASYSLRPDVQPRVLILKDEVPNAYACPGGYMFVTTGLLALCRDESELAGIMGHEFAHVARKHSLEGLKKKRFWSCAGDEASKYAGKDWERAYKGFKGATDAVINGVVNNRHGKKAEEQADELGAEWAARAGYDPAGLGRLIGRLPDDGKKSAWKEQFSVYPSGETRAQRIAKTVSKKGLTGPGVRNAARYKRELAGILK